MRKRVLERDENCCVVCGSREKLEVDHMRALMNGGDNRGAEWMVYRHHTESPVAFQDSIRVTMEHGHGNHRADNWYTVAYWYQDEPHVPFQPLPDAADRVPNQVDTGGPTLGKQ